MFLNSSYSLVLNLFPVPQCTAPCPLYSFLSPSPLSDSCFSLTPANHQTLYKQCTSFVQCSTSPVLKHLLLSHSLPVPLVHSCYSSSLLPAVLPPGFVSVPLWLLWFFCKFVLFYLFIFLLKS